MALPPGTHLGSYSVTAKIGAGGMASSTVPVTPSSTGTWRLKVLPEAFTSDHDRLDRFEREAKVFPSLNHPNIASIHGFEELRKMLAARWLFQSHSR